jgi:hypothetical protein
VAVECQPVVLRDAPELRLELRDNTEVSIDDAFGAADRFAVVQVRFALGGDDVDRYFQPDGRVDAAVPALIVLVVGVQDHDLVAQEPGGLRPPVRDQGLDLLSLPPGSGEPQRPVVGVPAIVQPAVGRIVGVPRGHGLHLLAQPSARLVVASLLQPACLLPQPHIWPRRGASGTPVVGGK